MRGTNREAGEQHCPRGLLIAGLECLSTCIFGEGSGLIEGFMLMFNTPNTLFASSPVTCVMTVMILSTDLRSNNQELEYKEIVAAVCLIC